LFLKFINVVWFSVLSLLATNPYWELDLDLKADNLHIQLCYFWYYKINTKLKLLIAIRRTVLVNSMKSFVWIYKLIFGFLWFPLSYFLNCILFTSKCAQQLPIMLFAIPMKVIGKINLIMLHTIIILKYFKNYYKNPLFRKSITY
jgi:hypothetical protein